jgi:RNA recognition motif-containing protein
MNKVEKTCEDNEKPQSEAESELESQSTNDNDEEMKKDDDANDAITKKKNSKLLEKPKQKRGVVYLSRIPTKMNVKLIREYFSKLGKIDRIYLEPKGNLNTFLFIETD